MKSLVVILFLALIATACLLPEEIEVERARARHGPSYKHRVQRLADTDPDVPIGTGDRFRGGKVAPVGIGMNGNDDDFDSVLNLDEVKSGLDGLERKYGQLMNVQVLELPYKTYENRSTYALKVGKPRVMVQSGAHARERGGPDNVIYFVADLLKAARKGVGLTYGDKEYSARDVKFALSAGIVIVPAVNVDGIAYDVESGSCWRKNRNMDSADDDDPATVGVDLNRNFDFLWDFGVDFNLASDIKFSVSDDPASELFHGESAASEPETQNVAYVLDRYGGGAHSYGVQNHGGYGGHCGNDEVRRDWGAVEDTEFDPRGEDPDEGALSFFLDIHSANGDVLYSWGDDQPQSDDTSQSFTNDAYDGLRGFVDPDPDNSTYKEYIEAADLSDQEAIATRMCEAMNDTSPLVPYIPVRTADFVPTSGGSNDYAMSAYYGHMCGANRVQGLGMEFGTFLEDAECPFYPTMELYRTSLKQVAVAMMELMLFAAGSAGQPKRWCCDE